MGNLCPCYGFVRTVLAPGFLRPGYHDQPRASRYPNEVIIDHSTVALASPALRHRCRIRLLHVAVIVVSVLAVIFDIAGKKISPKKPGSIAVSTARGGGEETHLLLRAINSAND